MTPLISVVVPVFNRASLVAETLASLEAQSLREWEAILVDDGSDDGTWEVLQEHARRDARFRPLLRPDGYRKGAAPCRNAGLDAAVGKYVVFLDSDDLMRPEALEKRVGWMEGSDLDLVVSQGQLFDWVAGDNPLHAFRENFPGENDLERFIRLDWPWQTTGPTWRTQWLLDNDVRWSEQHTSHDDTVFHLSALTSMPRYEKRFDDGPDFDFRTKDTEHQGLCDAYAEAWSLQAAAPGFLKTAKGIRRAGLPIKPYQHALHGLSYFLAGHLHQSSRIVGLKTWIQAFTSGMVSPADFALGLIHLLVQKTRLAGLFPQKLLERCWDESVFRKKPCRSFGHEPTS